MNKLKTVLNYARYARGSKLLTVMAFVLICGITVALNSINHANPASAASHSCNGNAIIRCGFDSTDDFVQKYQANAPGDLPTIYANFGLQPNDLDRFSRTAKNAVIYKNGDIRVDGHLVATGAQTVGRQNKWGSHPISIGGNTYYLTPTDHAFVSEALPALVMMTGDHLDFLAMNACGNAAVFTQPEYHCDMLNTNQVSRDTFQFNTNATANNGASISKVVYEYGDGTSDTKDSPSETVTHTYAQPGNYTAKVTVYYSVYGETKISSGESCSKPIEVKPAPVYACTVLEANQITRTKYEFTATGVAENGATIESADFDFGDNNGAQGTQPTDATHVKVEHEYTKAGDYTTTVKLNIKVNGEAKQITSDQCAVKVTVKAEECKPGIPVGSKECLPSPISECTNLEAIAISRTKYEFTSTGVAQNGATLVAANFDFGDGNWATGVKPINETQAKATHEYGAPGTYNATVRLIIKTDDKTSEVTSAKCAVKVTVNQEECKPGIPVGSPACKPVPPTPPATPATPVALPSTGPTEVIGSTVGLGGIVAAGTHFVRARRTLRGSYRNKK